MRSQHAPRLSQVPAPVNEWGPEASTGIRRTIVARNGYTRVRYTIESRYAALELRAASANDLSELSAMPDIASVYLWDAQVAHLSARTRTLCACPACAYAEGDCSLCFGSGRVEAWLEVRTVRSFQVVVHGEGEAREQHVDIDEPADFDRGEWSNQLLHQAWYRSVPGQLAKALHPTLDQETDRIIWVQVQVFVG